MAMPPIVQQFKIIREFDCLSFEPMSLSKTKDGPVEFNAIFLEVFHDEVHQMYDTYMILAASPRSKKVTLHSPDKLIWGESYAKVNESGSIEVFNGESGFLVEAPIEYCKKSFDTIVDMVMSPG